MLAALRGLQPWLFNDFPMIFQLTVHPHDEGGRFAPLWIIIHGRLLEHRAFAITANGQDMMAHWTGEALRLQRPLTFSLGNNTIRVLDEIVAEDIPPAMLKVLDALRDAGDEAGVETCDFCGLVLPATLIQVVTSCVCPKRLEGAHMTKHKKAMAKPNPEDPPF